MKQHQNHPQEQLVHVLYDETWFETLFVAIDRLHDAVSDDRPADVSPLAPAEMVGWLQDIAYTAQEAIFELRAKHPAEYVTEAGHPYSG